MRLLALFSGGKDSTFAIHTSLNQGHSVKYLLSMVSKNPESYMFHYPNIEFTSYQAECMDIPIILSQTKGEKEIEVMDMKKAIERVNNEIDGILAGGLASRYQYNRIRSVAESLGLKTIVPCWNMDAEKYWNSILESGFKVMITGVSCEGLGKEWLGRVIDKEKLKELKKISEKYRFNLAFEGGEAETFVLDCPLFKKRIEVLEGEVVWNRDSGFYLFKKVRLVKKN